MFRHVHFQFLADTIIENTSFDVHFYNPSNINRLITMTRFYTGCTSREITGHSIEMSFQTTDEYECFDIDIMKDRIYQVAENSFIVCNDDAVWANNIYVLEFSRRATG